MELSGQIPWWLDHVGVPLIFLLVGASLGFAAGRLKDWLDARKVKKSFLKAIRVELLTLNEHLKGTLKDVAEVRDSLDKKVPKALHLATVFQTGVYTCQLGKLRDVSDPLVLETIRFYDQLSNLERVKNHAAARSFELTASSKSTEGIQWEAPIVLDYIYSLDEVIRRISQLLSAAESLISKLPQS